MNKITTVNLGGYPFTIDENAHEALEIYLQTIESHFSDSEGCDEILDDIEARIAELFTDFLNGKSIVTIKEYNAMVKVMGRPEDFGAEAMDEDEYQEPKASTEKRKGKYAHIKTGKRLFRDVDDKVIGGVCSGVAAYFGIADPLWVRLGFIGLVFVGGITVLLYPVLWAIVPAAVTAGDKLKMKGEPATVSNIAKTVEEELTDLSKKISEMSKDLGSKKKVKSASIFSPKNAISSVISLLGGVVLRIIKVLKAIFKPIFSLTLGILLLSLGLAWAAWIITYLSSLSFINHIGPSPWILSTIGGLAGFLTVGIPIIWMMLLITRWFSSYRIPKKWKSSMRLTWVASFIIAGIVGFMTGMSYKNDAQITKSESYNLNSDEVIISRLVAKDSRISPLVNLFGLKYSDDGIVMEDVGYEVLLGDSEDVEINTHIWSKGSSGAEAQELANNVNAEYVIDGGEIKLPKEFEIKRGDKFRGQSVKYTIKVPVGTKVRFDESFSYRMWRTTKFKEGGIPEQYVDYTWVMTEEGLASLEWQKQYNAERVISVKSMRNLNLDGKMNATIKMGTENKIVLKGRKEDLDKVEQITTNDATSLKLASYPRGTVSLEIFTPELQILNAKDLRGLKVEGFRQEKMELNYSGRIHDDQTIKGYMDINDLTCNIGGSNKVNLIGSGKNLTINILDGARVIAEQYKAESVTVTGNVHSRSTFYASESFDCPDNQRYDIKLFGNPELLADKFENK